MSATGAVGSNILTLTFSEPVYCSPPATEVPAGTWVFTPADITITDFNSANDPDPSAQSAGTNACGSGPTTADTSFTVIVSPAWPSDRSYTVTLTPETNDINDIVGNDLANPATVLFTTGAGDFTPPTLVDSRVANNLGTTDWGYSTLGVTESGDSFTTTFSETMTGTASAAATPPANIQIQDQDGTVLILTCGGTVTCGWNATVTTLTVTTTGSALAPSPASAIGTTPGMQIPFNITSMNGFTDLQGNVPNVLGSADRLVDYE